MRKKDKLRFKVVDVPLPLVRPRAWKKLRSIGMGKPVSESERVPMCVECGVNFALHEQEYCRACYLQWIRKKWQDIKTSKA